MSVSKIIFETENLLAADELYAICRKLWANGLPVNLRVQEGDGELRGMREKSESDDRQITELKGQVELLGEELRVERQLHRETSMRLESEIARRGTRA